MNSSLVRRLALAGFFLLIFGSKLWLLSAAGTDLPVLDQWDAEAEGTLRAWQEGTFGIPQLVKPHNEHRIITTRLFVLGLFLLNGQWSAFLESVVSAGVHALVAVVLLRCAFNWLPHGWLLAFGGVLLTLFCAPFAWENTLVGFQVQFYFLLLFSVGHIVLTLESERFSWRWAAGQLCGVLSGLSMASGMISALAVLGVLGWQATRRRVLAPAQAVSALLALGFAATSWSFRTEVPGHAPLKAQGVSQIMDGFMHILAWPWKDFVPLALVPLGLAGVFFWRRLGRSPSPGHDAVLAGLLGWVWLQFLATAWARGGGGSTLWAIRYQDLFAFHVAIVFVLMVRETSRRTRVALAGGFGVAVLAGVLWATPWSFLRTFRERNERQERHVRAVVVTGDPSHLRAAPRAELPYPEPETVIVRLSTPAIRDILSPSVRRPLPLGPGVPPDQRRVPPALQDASREVAWSSWPPTAARGATTWRSAEQPATVSTVLRFQVAGDLGAPGKALRLLVRTAKGEAAVIPAAAPGERWKALNVFRPAGPWWIEASADDPDAWFAFTAPVEVALGTWTAERLIHDRAWIMALGGALLAASAALAWRGRATASPRGSPAPPAS